MNILAFVSLLVALILFLISAARVRPLALVDLGLAALALGLILQFAMKAHTIHF